MPQRRLAAIMYTDMVGYTALGQRNEALSLTLLEEQRRLVRPILLSHNGREVKTIGDAFLVEFPNALDAVRCAYEIQRVTREYNIPRPAESRIRLRIGLHMGDVVESEGDISGDAVNVASRIEPLAEEGGVCLTRPVFESTHNKFDAPLVSVGPKSLKNVQEPVEVYRMEMPWQEPAALEASAFPTNRIAVLPFRNMSPDPNDEYFAEGITEEIISTVAGISGLKVISRTSVMGYKGTTKRVEEIGRELKVGSVLEGSLRKAGDKIRVTAQLIDVAGDEHLWSQNYDRDLKDVFIVQSDIAKQVADALRVRILSTEKVRIEITPTTSAEAYTWYLKGRALWNKRGLDDLKRAVECFERAISEDANFALGYTGLADSYTILANNWTVDVPENLNRAEGLIAKALELDPDLAEAHASKGLLLVQRWDLAGAESEFRKALSAKPSYSAAHIWFLQLLLTKFNRAEAFEHMQKALETDPLSPAAQWNSGYYHYTVRDYPSALEHFRRAADILPSDPYNHIWLIDVYGRLRMFEDMDREADIVFKMLPPSESSARKLVEMTKTWYRGDLGRVRLILTELEASPERFQNQTYVTASFRFYLGDVDRGFELLDESLGKKERLLLDLRSDDALDGVRDDPRYLDMLKRLPLE